MHSPSLAPWQAKILTELKKRAPQSPQTLWVLSSGTQSVNEVKAIALTYDAVFASARAVNAHLDAKTRDRWLLCLPVYHVGGLSILARAFLSKSEVFQLAKWDPRAFCEKIKKDKITLCSLVPTQIHDLAAAGLQCPAGLRAIVVGGGSLDPALYASGRRLGWPLLPSYGLTECCSQVATADFGSLEHAVYPGLKVLSHAKVELREQRVFVQSASVCKWIARGDRDGQFTLEDPRRDGWLPTEDLAEWYRGGLKILGRRDDVVKVLGALVPLNQVEHEAREFFARVGLPGDLTVLAVEGGREGARLVLVTDSAASLREWNEQVKAFNSKAPGPHRIKNLCWTGKIPRGELGKVKRGELRAKLRL